MSKQSFFPSQARAKFLVGIVLIGSGLAMENNIGNLAAKRRSGTILSPSEAKRKSVQVREFFSEKTPSFERLTTLALMALMTVFLRRLLAAISLGHKCR